MIMSHGMLANLGSADTAICIRSLGLRVMFPSIVPSSCSKIPHTKACISVELFYYRIEDPDASCVRRFGHNQQAGRILVNTVYQPDCRIIGVILRIVHADATLWALTSVP